MQETLKEACDYMLESPSYCKPSINVEKMRKAGVTQRSMLLRSLMSHMLPEPCGLWNWLSVSEAGWSQIFEDFNDKSNFMLPTECLCAPHNSYVEILILKVMVLESGALGRVLRSWARSPREQGQCPQKRDPRELPCPFHHVRTQREEGSHQTPSLLLPQAWASSLQNGDKSMYVASATPCTVFVLQQPERIKTLCKQMEIGKCS